MADVFSRAFGDKFFLILVAGAAIHMIGQVLTPAGTPNGGEIYFWFFFAGCFVWSAGFSSTLYNEETGEPLAFTTIPAVRTAAWIALAAVTLFCAVQFHPYLALFVGGLLVPVPIAFWYHNRPEIIRARREQILQQQRKQAAAEEAEREAQLTAQDAQLGAGSASQKPVSAEQPSAIAQRIADELRRKQ